MNIGKRPSSSPAVEAVGRIGRTRSISYSQGTHEESTTASRGPSPSLHHIPSAPVSAAKHGAISGAEVVEYMHQCQVTPYSPVTSPSPGVSRGASPSIQQRQQIVQVLGEVDPFDDHSPLPRRGSFVGGHITSPSPQTTTGDNTNNNDDPTPGSPVTALAANAIAEMAMGELKVAMEELASASFSMWGMLADYKGPEGALIDFIRNEDIQTRTTLSATKIRETAFHGHDHHDKPIARPNETSIDFHDNISNSKQGSPTVIHTDTFTVDFTYLLDSRAAEIVGDISNVHCPLGQDPSADQKDSRFQVMTDNSAIETTELVYVRVWNSRREGRKYQQALKALSQSRQDLMLPAVFSVPHSVALAYQGKYVTVTWLVPLMDEFPVNLTDNSLVKAVEQCWKVALGVPSDSETIPVYIGADGRYYVFGGPEVLYHALATPPKFPGSNNVQRTELSALDAFQERHDKNIPSEINTQHVHSALYTRVLHAVRRWLKDKSSFPESDPELFSRLMKNAGLNMQYLYEVRAYVQDNFSKKGKIVGSTFNLKSLREKAKKEEENEDNGVQVDGSTKVEFLALIDEEMVCRTMLSIVEAAIGVAANTLPRSKTSSRRSSIAGGESSANNNDNNNKTRPGSSSILNTNNNSVNSDKSSIVRPDRLLIQTTVVAAANAVLTDLKENPDYMKVDVMYVLRLKFNAPHSFSLKTSDINLNNVWYFVADRLGITFDDSLGKFVGIEDPMPLGHSGRHQMLTKHELEDRENFKDAADTKLITKSFIRPEVDMQRWLTFLNGMGDSFPPTLRNVAALYALSNLVDSTMQHTFMDSIPDNEPCKKPSSTASPPTLETCFHAYIQKIVGARVPHILGDHLLDLASSSSGRIAVATPTMNHLDGLHGTKHSLFLAIIGETAPLQVHIAHMEVYLLSNLATMSAYDVAYYNSRAEYLSSYFRSRKEALGVVSRARLLKCWSGAIDIGHEVFEADPLWHVRQTASSFSIFSTQPTHVNHVITNLKYIEVRRDIVIALVITAGVDSTDKHAAKQDHRVTTGALEIAAILALVNFDDLLDDHNQLSVTLCDRLCAMIVRLADTTASLAMALSLLLSRKLLLLPKDCCDSSSQSQSMNDQDRPNNNNSSNPFRNNSNASVNNTSNPFLTPNPTDASTGGAEAGDKSDVIDPIDTMLERIEEARYTFTKLDDAQALNNDLFTIGTECAPAIRTMVDHLKTGLTPQHECIAEARSISNALSLFLSCVEFARQESIAHEEATGNALPMAVIAQKVSALTLSTADAPDWANVTILVTNDNAADHHENDEHAKDLKTGFATREAICAERSLMLSFVGSSAPPSPAVKKADAETPITPRGRLAAGNAWNSAPFTQPPPLTSPKQQGSGVDTSLLQATGTGEATLTAASRTNSNASRVRSVGWGEQSTDNNNPFGSPFNNSSFGSPSRTNADVKFAAFGDDSDPPSADPFADGPFAVTKVTLTSQTSLGDDVASRRSSVSHRRQSRTGSLAPKFTDSVAKVAPSSDTIFNYYGMKQVVSAHESKHAIKEFTAACHGTWHMLSEYSGTTGAIQAFERNNILQARTSLSALDVRDIALLKRSPDLFSEEYTNQLDSIAAEIVMTSCENVFEGFSQERNENSDDGEHRQIISTESYVDTEELVYVRVWNSRREGRKYQQALKALSQSRQDLMLPAVFSVPHSVALAYQGKYVTVTWLVPLMDEFQMPLSEGQSLVGAVEECWRVAMGVPLSASRLPMFVGADGRYYAIGVQEVLYHSLAPKFAGSSTTQRTEFCALDIFRERFDRNLRSEINTQHIQNALFDRVMHTLRDWLKDKSSFPESDPELFSRLMKNAGLNMQYLYEVRAYVQDNFNGVNKRSSLTASMIKANTISRGSVTNLPRNTDSTFECDADAKLQFLALIDEEMACRSVLAVIEAAIGISANRAMDDTDFALAAANDVLAELKDNPPYFRCDIMHVMRQKFNAPPTFSLDLSDVNFSSICFFVGDRLGLVFDSETELFTEFEEPLPLGHTGRRVLNYEEKYKVTRPFMKPITLSENWLKYLKSMEELDAPALRTVAAINALSALNEAGVWGEISIEEYTLTVKDISETRLPTTTLDPHMSNKNLKRRQKVRGIPTALTLAVIGETCPDDLSIANKELMLLSALPNITYFDVAYICDRLNYLQASFRLQGVPLTINDRARLCKCWGGALALGHEVFESDPLWHVRQSAVNFAFFSTLATNINKIITNLQFIDLRRDITISMVVCGGVDALLISGDENETSTSMEFGSGRSAFSLGGAAKMNVGSQQACAVMALVNFDDLLSKNGTLSDTLAARLLCLLDHIAQTAFSVAMGLTILAAEKLDLLKSEDEQGESVGEFTHEDGEVEEIISHMELHGVVENARFTFNSIEDAQSLNDELYEVGEKYNLSIRALRDHLHSNFPAEHHYSEHATILARTLGIFISRVQFQKEEIAAAIASGQLRETAIAAVKKDIGLTLQIDANNGDVPLLPSSTHHSRSVTPSATEGLAPEFSISVEREDEEEDDGEDLRAGFASREAVEMEKSQRCASSMDASTRASQSQAGANAASSLFLSISAAPPRSATPRVPGKIPLPSRQMDDSDFLSMSTNSLSQRSAASGPRRTVLTPTATGFTIEVGGGGEMPSRSPSPSTDDDGIVGGISIEVPPENATSPDPEIPSNNSPNPTTPQTTVVVSGLAPHQTSPLLRRDTQKSLGESANKYNNANLLLQSPNLGTVVVETDDDTASRGSGPPSPRHASGDAPNEAAAADDAKKKAADAEETAAREEADALVAKKEAEEAAAAKEAADIAAKQEEADRAAAIVAQAKKEAAEAEAAQKAAQEAADKKIADDAAAKKAADDEVTARKEAEEAASVKAAEEATVAAENEQQAALQREKDAADAAEAAQKQAADIAAQKEADEKESAARKEAADAEATLQRHQARKIAEEEEAVRAQDEAARAALRDEVQRNIEIEQQQKADEWEAALARKRGEREAAELAKQDAHTRSILAIDEAAAALSHAKREVVLEEASIREPLLQTENSERDELERHQRRELLEATVREGEGNALREKEAKRLREVNDARSKREKALNDALDIEERALSDRLDRHRKKCFEDERDYIEGDEMRARRMIIGEESTGVCSLQEKLDRITSRLRTKERLRGAGMGKKPPILQDIIDIMVLTSSASPSPHNNRGGDNTTYSLATYEQNEKNKLSAKHTGSRSEIEDQERYAFNAIIDAFVIETRVMREECDAHGMIFGTAASYQSRVVRCEREEGVSRSMIAQREYRLRKELAALASGRNPEDVDRGITPEYAEAPAAIRRAIPPPVSAWGWSAPNAGDADPREQITSAPMSLQPVPPPPRGVSDRNISSAPHAPRVPGGPRPIPTVFTPTFQRHPQSASQRHTINTTGTNNNNITGGGHLRYGQRLVSSEERQATASLLAKLRNHGAVAEPITTTSPTSQSTSPAAVVREEEDQRPASSAAAAERGAGMFPKISNR